MDSHNTTPTRLPGDEDNTHVHEHVSDSLGDAHADDYDMDLSHDAFIDYEQYTHLLNRTAVLETQMATLNENITKLSDLFNSFIRSQSMRGRGGISARASGQGTTPLVEIIPPTNGGHGAGASAAVGYNPISNIPNDDGPLPTPEMVALLKNTKPPIFKGEDKERNKDAVNTFLHKWGLLHALRHTLDAF